jgi:hypothetical protein
MVQFFKAGANMKDKIDGHVAEGLTQIANNLEKLVRDIKYLDKQLPSYALASAPTTPLDRAKRDYRNRRKREAIFKKPDLFGEPAWDMLVDLFIASEEGTLISVPSLCIASGVPSTTALRWIVILEQEKLIMRTPDPNDQRRVFLSLTDMAKTHLQALFELV